MATNNRDPREVHPYILNVDPYRDFIRSNTGRVSFGRAQGAQTTQIQIPPPLTPIDLSAEVSTRISEEMLRASSNATDTLTAATAATGMTGPSGYIMNSLHFNTPSFEIRGGNEDLYSRMRINLNEYQRQYFNQPPRSEMRYQDEPISIGISGVGGIDGIVIFLQRRLDTLTRYYRESRPGSADEREYSKEISEIKNLLRTTAEIKSALSKNKSYLPPSIDSRYLLGIYFAIFGEEGTDKAELITLLPFYLPTLNQEKTALVVNPESTRKFNDLCSRLTRNHSSIVRFIRKREFEIVDSSESTMWDSQSVPVPMRRLYIDSENYVKFFCNLKQFGEPVNELKG